MKVFDIALKDLLRSLRSAFLLVMMFLAPLLITGILYFAFGSQAKAEASFALPPVRVRVANLDQPGSGAALAAGELLADYLQGGHLADVVQVTAAPDEASARAAVDRRDADVAVIMPPNLTEAAQTGASGATVVVYHDPTLSVGPSMVRVLVSDFLDGLTGARIAVDLVADRLGERHLPADAGSAEAVAQRYVDWLRSLGPAHGGEAAREVLAVRAPATATPVSNPGNSILGTVMAAMMIFFAFFTGAAGASSIIYEEEGGTLARLLGTPTPRGVILAGKLAGVIVTLVVQIAVLLVASSLLFGIAWGDPVSLLVVTLGLVIAAAGFGVLLISFMKGTRQAGPVMGGVVTLTGMIGGLITAPIPGVPAVFGIINLSMPQGWALRGYKLVVGGASAPEVLLPAGVLAAMGVAFFALGVSAFRRRLA